MSPNAGYADARGGKRFDLRMADQSASWEMRSSGGWRLGEERSIGKNLGQRTPAALKQGGWIQGRVCTSEGGSQRRERALKEEGGDMVPTDDDWRYWEGGREKRRRKIKEVAF